MEMKTTVLTDQERFPEAPRWHEGKLWFSDFFKQRVMRVDLQGNVETVLVLNDLPTGLGWTTEGCLLVVSANERRLLQLEDDGLVEVGDVSDLAELPCNDLVVDAQGRAYLGTIGFDFSDPQSVPKLAPILLVPPKGSPRTAADGLAFPNGMVITPDGKTLIVAESYGGRLTAFDIEPDGALSHRRTWAKFDDGEAFDMYEGRVAPDGICLDAEGAVWVASTNTKEVLRVHQGGEITHQIKMKNTPLACMTGGPDRRTLFICTTESLDFNDQKAKGQIEYFRIDVPGAGIP